MAPPSQLQEQYTWQCKVSSRVRGNDNAPGIVPGALSFAIRYFPLLNASGSNSSRAVGAGRSCWFRRCLRSERAAGSVPLAGGLAGSFTPSVVGMFGGVGSTSGTADARVGLTAGVGGRRTGSGATS